MSEERTDKKIVVPVEDYRQAKSLAALQGITLREYIRRALVHYNLRCSTGKKI